MLSMLRSLELQNFRNYPKGSFEFGENTTLIVGPNAIGKTNILEAIYCLATGKSFRAETERELVGIGNSLARIEGKTEDNELEIIWDNRERFQKLYRVNGVGKRMVDFVGNLRVVLFCPQGIEIVADSPSTRRRYLDSVLSLVYRDYRVASHIYERALRQRNRLLWRIREEQRAASSEQLGYWDDLLITNGGIIYQRRKEYLDFLGFDYDYSIISAERLRKYAAEEIAAATTLVGPQRDDFKIVKNGKNLHTFGSRGEQRLAIFEMKLKELEYVEKITGEKPVLLLDDIFSELDHNNRHRILQVIPKQQTIMTTTDLHLVEKEYVKHVEVVELG